MIFTKRGTMTALQWCVIPFTLVGIMGSTNCSVGVRNASDYGKNTYNGPASGDADIDCMLMCDQKKKDCVAERMRNGESDAVAGNLCLPVQRTCESETCNKKKNNSRVTQ